MVNETNKPSNLEYEQLNERLAASNRHLIEMEEEHHNLLQEMEVLRERATMLTRRDESFESSTISSRSTTNEEPVRISEAIRTSSSTASSTASTASGVAKSSVTESREEIRSETSAVNSRAQHVSAVTVDNEDEDEDPEEADFIRKKLEEIAGLKAQLKRVQHMTNTTKLIEEHMQSTRAVSAMSSSSSSSVQEEMLNEQSLFSSMQNRSAEMSSSSAVSSATRDAKAELLETMTSMFTDYASDLRGQADNLREERERIKALKDKIIQSKRQF